MPVRPSCRLLLLALAAALGGCVTPTAPPTPLEDVQCVYRFRNVERQSERDRIGQLMIAAAREGKVVKRGTDADPTYEFVAHDLRSLDWLHGQILAMRDTGRGAPADARDAGARVFEARNAVFQIDYSTIGIGASLQVVLRFKVTPGSKLYYKPQGDAEQDITELTDAGGNVELRTNIREGQRYLYGRTVSGQVERFIRVNVYTQQVEDIPRSEYPREAK